MSHDLHICCTRAHTQEHIIRCVPMRYRVKRQLKSMRVKKCGSFFIVAVVVIEKKRREEVCPFIFYHTINHKVLSNHRKCFYVIVNKHTVENQITLARSLIHKINSINDLINLFAFYFFSRKHSLSSKDITQCAKVKSFDI